jgi:hypothetical protein
MAQRRRLTMISALALLTTVPALAFDGEASQSAPDRFAQLGKQDGVEGTQPRHEALARALDHLEITIAEARTASGSSFRAFAALGISTFDPVLGRVKSAREVLYEMSERFAATRDDANKADIAQAMLGADWAALMPYLNKGPAGVRELEERQPDRR